ncbi:GNAT family N-acetyltransferase [Winogradskya consettensis]|uniref:N-acetyltransferase n=1 Tax=Winogradskya consettensis TaxID=113560 RepID=A0A919T1X6_9ACTN|nr:GNAT family N-acetyltransferase [Actinoplanes consettensis]GIM83901.1 N-acetyltransferase [Actinoplanes consettensis]
MTEIRLEVMTQVQYEQYRESAEKGYAKQVTESGDMSSEEAAEKASRDYARILPHGMQTDDQHFFQAYVGDDAVGMIWYSITPGAAGSKAWIYDFEVGEHFQRRGYGRAIMRAGEEFCRSRGVASIGLNVFGGNDGARALYEQEGYEITALQMRKHLGGPESR